MLVNIVFLVLYTFLSSFLGGTELYYILSIHLFIYVIDSVRLKKATSPIILFAIGAIIVNIANVTLIDQYNQGRITTYSYLVPKYIDEAAQIWCISCTLIIIGFLLTNKKSLPSISIDIKKEHLKIVFIVLLVLNLATIVNPDISFRRSFKIFGLLNTFGILFFARIWAKENNTTFRTFSIALLVVETYIALTTSYLRFELIFPTVCLFLGYFLGKGDIKYVFSYRIIPYLVLGVVFASIFSSLQNNRQNFISVFYDESDNRAAKISEKDENKNNALLIRSANVAQVSNVVNLVNQNGLYNGRASAPLVIALIPRVLWPNKPSIQLGAWFALEIGQANQNEKGDINNSINMTVMGEMFLDFGWIGVIIGSLLLGAFIAILWNATHFYASPYNITGTIFGGYLFVMLFLGIAADLQIVITFMSYYLILWATKKGIQYLY